MSLCVETTIEFNSDPEDDEHPQSHIHSGEIIKMAAKSNQINVRLDNDESYSYFMDEIKIRD